MLASRDREKSNLAAQNDPKQRSTKHLARSGGWRGPESSAPERNLCRATQFVRMRGCNSAMARTQLAPCPARALGEAA